jgi:hypothetical protein
MAERLSQEVLKAEPQNAQARLLRARALLDSGRAAEAEKELFGLKASFAGWPAAHYWYAQAAEASGKLELAREAMRTVANLQKAGAGQSSGGGPSGTRAATSPPT